MLVIAVRKDRLLCDGTWRVLIDQRVKRTFWIQHHCVQLSRHAGKRNEFGFMAKRGQAKCLRQPARRIDRHDDRATSTLRCEISKRGSRRCFADAAAAATDDDALFVDECADIEIVNHDASLGSMLRTFATIASINAPES